MKTLSLVFMAGLFGLLTAQADPVLSHTDLLRDIAKARTVQVCQITPGEGTLERGKWQTLSNAKAKQLIGILTNPAAYIPGPHRCPFQPSYEVALSGRFGKLNIQYCFHCLDYQATLDGGVGHESQSFDPSAAALKGFFEGLGLRDE
ncbi:hypothetical protein BH09VER1_BH09VER1_43920 [soil metagenome]